MTTHQDREQDAAARLLDAVERLTGERPGHLHQRDTGVYTRMAELIERAADEQSRLEDRCQKWEQTVRLAYACFIAAFTGNPVDERHAQEALMDCMYQMERDGDLPAQEASDGE